jgi:hypothetical protein
MLSEEFTAINGPLALSQWADFITIHVYLDSLTDRFTFFNLT